MPDPPAFYDGLEAVIRGVRRWIARHAEAARVMAGEETRPQAKENIESIASICGRLAGDPPRTFREACQWLVQLGGPDAAGRDLTSRVSFFILEAIHRLKIPANIALRVGDDMDPELFRRGVEILMQDGMGFPKFVTDKALTEGCLRRGYSAGDARRRIYAGCQWMAVPGREYGLMDMIKVDLAASSRRWAGPRVACASKRVRGNQAPASSSCGSGSRGSSRPTVRSEVRLGRP